MNKEEALHEFIGKAATLVAELESAIESGQDQGLYFGNAEIALVQVRTWLDLARNGELAGRYGAAGFGISKSDLMFGPAEPALYELEKIYCTYLSAA